MARGNEVGSRARRGVVTNISTEQKNAVSALIARAYSKGESAEELSRAIRPCIGLAQRQAIANANYYDHVKDSLLKNNPGMKEATAAKKAQEAAAKYAAQQHRYRANMIAETEMAFAYQHGEYEAVKMAQAQGLMGVVEKVWSTAYDDGVCDICNGLEGQTIGIDDDFNFKLNKLLFGGQRLTPPAHPQCRCAVEYREISPPVIHPAQSQVPGPNIPDPATPSIPDSLQMPQGMKDKGLAHLGGTGEMHLCEDGSGTEWHFQTGTVQKRHTGRVPGLCAGSWLQGAGHCGSGHGRQGWHWKHRRPVWCIPAEN